MSMHRLLSEQLVSMVHSGSPWHIVDKRLECRALAQHPVVICKREVKCENVVVPTVDELEVWVSMLKTWHTAPLVSQDFDVPKDRPVMPLGYAEFLP